MSTHNSPKGLSSTGEFLDLTSNIEFRFSSVYLPSVDYVSIAKLLSLEIPAHSQHIVAADFNIPAKSSPQKTLTISSLTKSLDVSEVVLSNFSHTFKHRAYDHTSSIDRIFVSPALLSKVSPIITHHTDFTVSDHLLLFWSLVSDKPTNPRQPPPVKFLNSPKLRESFKDYISSSSIPNSLNAWLQCKSHIIEKARTPEKWARSSSVSHTWEASIVDKHFSTLISKKISWDKGKELPSKFISRFINKSAVSSVIRTYTTQTDHNCSHYRRLSKQ
eukprot:TRINITY_DN1093_c0_g1_i11.p1 TRINITY_DN1093_c0_g1~~TRINITY_DN1093_c0_g1_i11.p1  ORF type:complete len:274 (-),score=9.19 TRINITY_DN1093_c0_g1_i11:1345-2166(-)